MTSRFQIDMPLFIQTRRAEFDEIEIGEALAKNCGDTRIYWFQACTPPSRIHPERVRVYLKTIPTQPGRINHMNIINYTPLRSEQLRPLNPYADLCAIILHSYFQTLKVQTLQLCANSARAFQENLLRAMIRATYIDRADQAQQASYLQREAMERLAGAQRAALAALGAAFASAFAAERRP